MIGKVLDRAGLSPTDVTLWEINEAFASVPIAACREYGLDEDRVNIYGSGCSLGHPIAATGARMLTTLPWPPPAHIAATPGTANISFVGDWRGRSDRRDRRVN